MERKGRNTAADPGSYRRRYRFSLLNKRSIMRLSHRFIVSALCLGMAVPLAGEVKAQNGGQQNNATWEGVASMGHNNTAGCTQGETASGGTMTGEYNTVCGQLRRQAKASLMARFPDCGAHITSGCYNTHQ